MAKLFEMEALFVEEFDSSQELRNAVQDALEELGLLDYIDIPEGIHDDWASVVAAFSEGNHSVQVAAIAGVTVTPGAPTVYPLPGFGWDGGNGISTQTINLDVLTSADVLSGPYAELVMRTDPKALGVAIHVYEAESMIVIHVF